MIRATKLLTVHAMTFDDVLAVLDLVAAGSGWKSQAGYISMRGTVFSSGAYDRSPSSPRCQLVNTLVEVERPLDNTRTEQGQTRRSPYEIR